MVPFFQPPKVVLFLEYSSPAAYEVSAVRDVADRKLPYFLEFLNETWWEWSLGINAGTKYAFVPFRHQGAELFSSKGGKMHVIIVFRFF